MKITKEEFEGIRTEINAGKVLFVRSEADKAWNDSADRCLRIVERYKERKGLFQLPTKLKDTPHA